MDELLPPGADARGGSADARPDALAPSAADELLPPGAAEGFRPGTQQAIPESPEKQPPPQPQKTADGSIVIPSEDGGFVTLREPVKTVGTGDEQRELRQLTPEEKASRRFRKNLILWSIGLILIIIAVAVLLALGPVH